MKVKSMSHRERKLLACEMRLRGFNVSYIHPHYYYDAKAVHDILFYPPGCQHEIQDDDAACYNALKEIVEDDHVLRVCFRRYVLLPRWVNDFRESKVVRKYISVRMNKACINAIYRILIGRSFDGECPRSLFLTLDDGSEVVYKMTSCRNIGKIKVMTFEY